jgi:multidrug efflux pump subunit AcrA (membrane-fusion protein)
LVLLVGALALLGGGAFAAVRAFSQPVVQVTRLVRGPVIQAFYATGTIVPEREYSVRSNVAGILFLEPGIDKGVRVARDQRLARVVSDDLEQKLKASEADMREKTARADDKTSPVLAEFDRRIEAFVEIYGVARRELQRNRDLAEQGGGNAFELGRAEDRVATARAELEGLKAQRIAKQLELRKELEVAQSNHDIAKWNIEQQEIRSPVDGVILDWPTPNRTRLAVNDHILLVADVRPERLVMRAAVDEEDKNKLHVGQVVRMTLYSFPDDKFTGQVKTIYDKADPQRRTFEVDVEIARPATNTPGQGAGSASAQSAVPDPSGPTTQPSSKFAPGMTGELAFVEREKAAADILPRQALQGDWFYVVRNGTVDRVPAKPGVRNVTRVEALEGIAPDTLVMISPIGKLQVGQGVRTDFMDPRAAADLNKPPEAEIFKGGF